LATVKALGALILGAIAQCAVAAELILAPGASVTILDGADPSLRIVMTAPANAALDLSELLSLKSTESVRSIVTRFQAGYAGGMTRNADGSITLGPSTATASRKPTPGLAGGVLIRNGEQWTLHPGTPAAQASAPPAANPPAVVPPARREIFKAGVTREQAERDIAQCRGLAEKSVTPLSNANERVNAYNGAMLSCLKSFGYEIRG
jgi:hypothetical protein